MNVGAIPVRTVPGVWTVLPPTTACALLDTMVITVNMVRVSYWTHDLK